MSSVRKLMFFYTKMLFWETFFQKNFSWLIRVSTYLIRMDKSFTDKGLKNAQTLFLGYNLFWGAWADSNDDYGTPVLPPLAG